MSRKTKTSQLKEFWKQKLNIKYDTEIEYYKKFCGSSYKYEMLTKDIDPYNESEKIIYENWEKHILKTIEKLSLEELGEYSKFLNQEYRNIEMQLNSFQSVLVPYAICIIGSGIISPIFDLILDGYYYFSIIAVIF